MSSDFLEESHEMLNRARQGNYLLSFQYLQKASDYRQKADYDFSTDIPQAEAAILVQYAAEFIENTKKLFTGA